MVRAKTNRPRRRNPGAAPKRKALRGTPKEEARRPMERPNMAARREWDRAQHVNRGKKMGLTNKQASRHAREEIQERDW